MSRAASGGVQMHGRQTRESKGVIGRRRNEEAMARVKKDTPEILAAVTQRSEKNRDKEVRYVRVGRPPKPVAERGQVYSIRIPVGRLEQLRLLADAEDKQPAVLARDWILERLEEESGVQPARLDAARAKHAARQASAPRPRLVARKAAAKKVAAKGSRARRRSRKRH